MNNFPTSRGLWDSAVVPLWEYSVEGDLHGFLESSGAFSAGLVYLVENAHLQGHSHGRFGLRHVVPGNLQSSEDHPTTGPRHMGK